MPNNTPTRANAHNRPQSKALLPWPQTPSSAKDAILVGGRQSLRQFASDHGLDYQALRDVLSRRSKPRSGVRLDAAIALGLVPAGPSPAIDMAMPPTSSPAELRIHAANRCLRLLGEAGVQVVGVDTGTAPYATVKIMPGLFTAALDANEMWRFASGGAEWREMSALYEGCLLVWLEESTSAPAKEA